MTLADGCLYLTSPGIGRLGSSPGLTTWESHFSEPQPPRLSNGVILVSIL